MKKVLFALISIAIFNSPTYSQGGWGNDPGLQDSIMIECDSLIVGRSMPITFRVVNDDPLRTVFTDYIFRFNNGAGMVFDSVKYLNYLLDPSVLDFRFSNGTDSTLRVGVYKIIGNDLTEGGSELVEFYYTATSPGAVEIDSISNPPGYDFVFTAQLPERYVIYEPQFQKKLIPIVEGTPFPILSIDENMITTVVNNQISTDISISSPVGFPVTLALKKFTKYDNADIPLNTPTITYNFGYKLEWTPSVTDIGIWEAVVEVCDSSGACVEGSIVLQVVESNDFLMEFSTKVTPNFHLPEEMIWEDLDSDLYPEIVTVGYNADLYSTFSVYDFNYDTYSLNIGFNYQGAPYRSHLALGYIDSDDILDAIYPGYMNQNAITVLPGTGNLEFDQNNLNVSYVSEDISRNAVLDDFNQDELLDYVSNSLTTVHIYKGLGTGYFQKYFEIEFNEKIRSINSADFNQDGNNDLAIGTDAGVYTYQNNGNETFQFIKFYPQSYGTVDIDITNQGSDFNGDLYYDFVITTPSVGGEFSEIVLYEGNANGTFDVTTVRTLKGQVFGNTIGDFNDDNYLDIAFVNGAKKYIGILYGEGDGNFANEQRFYISDIPIFSINSVDFDLDGDLDISSVGTDNNANGTLFLLINQDNSASPVANSLALDVLNNANMQMTSPAGKKINKVSTTFTSSSSYLKNIDNNNQIDNKYFINTLENGVYTLEFTPKPNLSVGQPFTAEFSIDREQYRLAKNIPMSSSGYTFLIYPSGTSPIFPIPGQFTGEKQPFFTWDIAGDVNFQLATDIDFNQLLIDSLVTFNNLVLISELPVSDTTAYYWRVKSKDQVDYDGIYVFNLVLKVPTDISDDINELPNDYSLSQNYPNPFNPSTQLNFSLPEKTHVKMEIFNSSGQRIRTLTNKDYTAGKHSVEWDGRNMNGKKTASGIYLMKFSSGSFSKSIKMLMMK